MEDYSRGEENEQRAKITVDLLGNEEESVKIRRRHHSVQGLSHRYGDVIQQRRRVTS